MRVRVVAGPWPERIGCEGTIVEAPAGYRGYPWGRMGGGRVIPRRGEEEDVVVVLLDDDPMVPSTHRVDPGDYGGQPYTCAIARDDLEVLDA